MRFYALLLLSAIVNLNHIFAMNFEALYFKILPSYGAQRGNGQDNEGITILMRAVSRDAKGDFYCPQEQQKAFIDFLIKKKKADVNHRNQMRQNALWYAVYSGNKIGMIALCDNGAVANNEETFVSTAILGWKKARKKNLKAVDADYTMLIKHLISAGFSLNVAAKESELPIVLAIKNIHLPGLLEILILHRVKTDLTLGEKQLLKFVFPEKIIFSLESREIFCLNKTITECSQMITRLSQSEKTYFSLLMPDVLKQVETYYNVHRKLQEQLKHEVLLANFFHAFF